MDCDPNVDRRAFLWTVGAVGATITAGCIGGGESQETFTTDTLYLRTPDIDEGRAPTDNDYHRLVSINEDETVYMNLAHVGPAEDNNAAYLNINAEEEIRAEGRQVSDYPEEVYPQWSTWRMEVGSDISLGNLDELEDDDDEVRGLTDVSVQDAFDEELEQMPPFTVVDTTHRVPNADYPDSEGWGGFAELTLQEPHEFTSFPDLNGFQVLNEANEGWANENLPMGPDPQ